MKNKEAFKGTLKQWCLISQAMLQGAENIDCFGDYSLTFSNVCGREREREANCCLCFSPFVKMLVFAFACACAHTCESNGSGTEGRRDSSPRKAGREGEGVSRGGRTPLAGGSALSSCFLPLSFS